MKTATKNNPVIDQWGNDQWAIFEDGASSDTYLLGPFNTYDDAAEALLTVS